MRLKLQKVGFVDAGEDIPSWAEIVFNIDVPVGIGVGGSMHVSLEMTREQFDSSTISDLARRGEELIHERAKL